MAQTFADRFSTTRSTFGPLVWGLDPSGAVLRSWGLTDSPDGLERFVDIALQAAVGAVRLIKPQSAFYERHGWRGIRTLARLVADARQAGLLVILDAKRGDVGSTNDAYAEAYLGSDAAVPVDALTVHPYLGFGAMRPFVERAHQSGSCLLVVTRSSNPEGRAVQAAMDETSRSVETTLLAEIGRQNAELAPGAIGPIGAVVGPTHMHPELDLTSANALYLAPGVGAQGATPSDVAHVFQSCRDRVCLVPRDSCSKRAQRSPSCAPRLAPWPRSSRISCALNCRVRQTAKEKSKVDVEEPHTRSTYVQEATTEKPQGVIAMPRFMGFVRMEEGVGTPPQALFDAMDEYIGERAAKGVFLDGGGLYGTEDAVNYVVRQGEVTRVDGPYAEAKEVVGGWAIMEYPSLEEAAADQLSFAELHAKHWPEITVISTLRQISTGPEAPSE